eukprot:TRINITY_DN15618_c0_g1_i1.p1 TRINITY_DN15618_c0_g1~~TRINITY_DN15618_c0_g1_i1.p1  ORF type:complete len:511 (-),score=59.12 TRINITY_DN15618_c0_g1_i1:26-1558(-)
MRLFAILVAGRLAAGSAEYYEGFSHVCLQHLGSFNLTWRVVKQDQGGDAERQRLASSPQGQALCVNLTEIAGIETGNAVIVEAFVGGVQIINSSFSVIYRPSSPLWATYACRDDPDERPTMVCQSFMEGSLWDGQPSVPTCGLSAVDREACGDSGTNQTSCLSKGCCWQPLSPNPLSAPSCFRKGMSGNGPTPPNKVLPFAPADCFAKDATFQVSELMRLNGVVYGAAVNPYFLGFDKTEILTLDILLPPASDTRKSRPALIWIHGGTFIDGDSTYDPGFREAAATRGYVVLSINYRLISDSVIPDVGALLTIKPGIVAMHDARAAVRFLRKNADKYRVDPGRIVIGGESAGALTANMLGYGKGFSEGLSGHAAYDSSVNGVISVSGSLRDLAMCSFVLGPPSYRPFFCALSSPPGVDRTTDLKSGDVPFLELHGTKDTVIPYINGREATDRATAVGVRNLFLTIPGAGHVPMGPILDPKLAYFHQWLNFTSGLLNLAQAECPSRGMVIV